MPRATVHLDPARTIAPIDPMIYGQYLEHVQPEDRCIYGAIVDDPSPLTEEDGFRTDVIDAVRELRVPIVRWPGGCFADIYHWEDGIGPRDRRPVRRNWHWGGVEPNTFGTDEFLAWCERIDTAPYLNFNLGTGTLDEAIRWLDYCNGSEPTHEVMQRQANGRTEPWNVRYWGVGNEQWGAWEAGHMDARSYTERLRNWTQFFRKLDPAASFLGIASSGALDPGWDREVLSGAGNLIDYLTLHVYGHSLVGEPDDYLNTVAFPVFAEERIRALAGLIDEASAELGIAPPRISIDEWNIRHLVPDPDTGERRLQRDSPRRLVDAISAAGMLNAMIRNAGSVGMANYVFLLNGNGVLLVQPEGIVRTPLYHLFKAYAELLTGTALAVDLDTESVHATIRLEKPGQSGERDVPWVDVVASRDSDRSRLAMAIVNRHPTNDAEVVVKGELSPHAELFQLHHPDAYVANTFDDPKAIAPSRSDIVWTGSLTVPPHSVSIVTWQLD